MDPRFARAVKNVCASLFAIASLTARGLKIYIYLYGVPNHILVQCQKVWDACLGVVVVVWWLLAWAALTRPPDFGIRF